jgi:hypothetical protein
VVVLCGGAGSDRVRMKIRVKNYDFTPKNHIFSNFRGGALGASAPAF